MLLFLIGLASGIISGMGIGGGAILIPSLVIFLKYRQHAAQSVNLLFFIPTAVIALIVHIKNKKIDLKTAIPILLFGLAGAFAGSFLAVTLDEKPLRKLFGVFLLLMGCYEMFRKSKPKKQQ